MIRWNRLLTCDCDFDRSEYELKLQYILFNSLLLFNMVLVGLAAMVRFYNHQLSQGMFDLLYILFGSMAFFLVRRSKKYFKPLVYFVLFFSLLIVTLTFYSGLNLVSGISWYFSLLLVTFFLTDTKTGHSVFFISTILIVLIGVVKYEYTYLDMALGLIPFFGALVFILFFEKRNKEAKRELEFFNSALNSHNLELKNLVHKSNSKLSASEKELMKLQQVLEKSPVSIIITDIEGNIEYANPRVFELTGYSSEELLGQNPRILKSTLYEGNFYKELWKDITHDQIWSGIFKNIKKSGEEYWESAIIAPVNDAEGNLENYFAIKQEITQQVYLENRLRESDLDKSENFEKTLESFVGMVEERDTYTAGHSQRVADYALLIAKEMRCSAVECDLIYQAAILHDIGKIATPDSVLLKPGKLNDLEYKLIQEHVQASYNILNGIPMYKEFADIIIAHHERFDGQGYPRGIGGVEIPSLSRILIVADAFDAMTTNRIYKGRMSVAEAIEEIKNASGKQFDPSVVPSALKALKNVKLQDDVSQVPKTDLERERFSYFYKDQVCDAYNADYLKYILAQNDYKREYNCLNLLYMHGFNLYNKKHGWNAGDVILQKFAKKLQEIYPNSVLFRIHGDDFVLMNREHLEVDMEQFETIDFLRDNKMSLSLRHIDLKNEEILEFSSLYQEA